MNEALEKVIKEGTLLPEDIAKLNTIIEMVRLNIERVVRKMPTAVQQFLQEPDIEPIMSENGRDILRITVNFYRSSGSVDSVCLIHGGQIFCVECLDPNISQVAVSKFKDIVLNYVRECYQFLDETAEVLQLASDYIQ